MKKYALVFLSVFLFISAPFAAHANIVTATGKYIINAVKHAPGGAKVEATNTATAAKHVIKHGVSSADLGKSIGAGIVGFGVGTGAGLAFKAITGLALDAVDWVLDPANNAIKYSVPSPVLDASKEYAYSAASGALISTNKQYVLDNICAVLGYVHVSATGSVSTCLLPDGSNKNYLVSQVPNPNYGGSTTPSTVDKYLPLDTVATQVIADAEAGNAAAQKDVEDHVTHRAQNGDLDNELDNSSDITPSEEPENPEEPQNPTEPKECPSGSVKVDDVCVKIPDSDGDEPLFCDSSEFTKKVCDWIDWTQEEHVEPEAGAGEIEVIDKSSDLSIDKDRIVFDNQCPTPKDINITVVGHSFSDALDYQPLCDFFIKLKPFVVGMGGISSALIIAGGVRRG